MKPMHPDDARALRQEFLRLVNLDAAELRAFLETDESRKVGMVRPGETESVGRQSARKTLRVLEAPAGELTEADEAHMKKAIGFFRRHLAQRPWGDVSRTRWRWSLVNWGHDPLKPVAPPPTGRR